MEYTIEDNAKTAEVLKEKLNLTRLPVAIKFFNDEIIPQISRNNCYYNTENYKNSPLCKNQN